MIAWGPWNAAAFARAAAERKAVLLSLTAAWCHGCHVMDATTYADPRVTAAVRDGFVPIRVDADRRPDLNIRYNLDGWPTTALLTPSGEILTGSTYLTSEAMLSMLGEAQAAMADRYEELMERADQLARERRAAPRAPRYEPDGDAPRWVLARLFEEEDREHGGFGTGGKYPAAAPLQLALAAYALTPDARLAALFGRALDAVSRGGLFDEVDGGVFRYAANRDFTRPHTEKLLEDQVALVPVLLDAAALTGRAAFRQRAIDLIRYVRRTLSDGSGVFFASQRPDPEYYALAGSIRASMDAPEVDRTAFTDLNAQAIVAWLHAAEATGDGELRAEAERCAGGVLIPSLVEGRGVRHWPDPDAPCGLLTDHVHAAWAFVHLASSTGRDEHLARASDVMRLALGRLWDDAGGGFFDRTAGADDVGLLRDRRKPLGLNSLAARVLVRLAALTGSDDLRLRARAALGAVTGSYRREGVGAAPYALAVLDVMA